MVKIRDDKQVKLAEEIYKKLREVLRTNKISQDLFICHLATALLEENGALEVAVIAPTGSLLAQKTRAIASQIVPEIIKEQHSDFIGKISEGCFLVPGNDQIH